MDCVDPMRSAERLRELMGFYQVSPEELGRDAVVDAEAIVGWTNGELPKDLGAVERVASMLGVSAGFLLMGQDE